MLLVEEFMTSEATKQDNVKEDELLEATRCMAARALSASVADWPDVGRTHISSSTPQQTDDDVPLETAIEDTTALFLVRLAACTENEMSKSFSDLSTSTICRWTLMQDRPWEFLTIPLLHQVREFVTHMLRAYRDLPFHNYQHAYHVICTANKLMDLMLTRNGSHESNGTTAPSTPPLFGLRQDARLLMAIFFAALIHDVDHRGVTNRQLSRDGDNLALIYNDQSMQEHHSLKLAFEALLDEKRFDELHSFMFPSESSFQRFRLFVIDMVLSTDIANPERAQVCKSKWKEAFGGDDEAGGDNRKHQSRRGSLVSEISMPRISGDHHKQHHRPHHRRGSNLSTSSAVSDVTSDSYIMMMKHQRRWHAEEGVDGRHHHNHCKNRRMSNESDYDSIAMYHHGKNSPEAVATNDNPTSSKFIESSGADPHHDSFVMSQDKSPRQHFSSHNSEDDSFSYEDYGHDSIRGHRQLNNSRSGLKKSASNPPRRRQVSRRWSTQSYHSNTSSSGGAMQSIAAESIDLAHKRGDGQRLTRQRNLNYGNNNYEYEYDDEDDSSLSLTPPSSEDEMDGIVVTGLTLSSSNHGRPPIEVEGAIVIAHKKKSPQRAPVKRVPSRRASTGTFPSRFGTLNGQIIDENRASKSIDDFGNDHHSHYDGSAFRKRLGIRRSMDLSGESIEVYSRHGSIGGLSTFSRENLPSNQELYNYDEPDDLKASAVAELILRVADVGHNFQKWDTMVKWMSRMFNEMLAAHKAGRGVDPRDGWFDNQVRIIESYLLPLANQLVDTGVLGAASSAASFVDNLKGNLDRWMVEGFDVVGSLLQELSVDPIMN